METCNTYNCNLDRYKNEEHCILHCKKNDYSTDFHNVGFLSLFYDKLIEDIVNRLFKHNELLGDNLDKETILTYLKNDDLDDNIINAVLVKSIIIPTHIIFPERDGRDNFDYLRILNLFGRIHFNYCSFYTSYLELDKTQCFFQDCKFYTYWTIYNYDILKNVNNVIYQQCEFFDTISGYHSGDNEKYSIYNNTQFHACIFHKKLTFENAHFLNMLFDNGAFSSNITILDIKECIFDGKFVLNNHIIENFLCEHSIFNEKFEFRENKIQEFKINDCNFYKIAYFYNSEFKEFTIFKSIFEKFIGFELCEFGLSEGRLQDSVVANFKYVTFLDFINFRKIKFHNGLDIENTNIKDSPNFLDIYVDFTNTNRETFRIIKNSFDKNGDYIEGNKFFSLEMKKYKEELKNKSWKNHFQEKIVFSINEKISNFGQNYFKSIGWILFFIVLYNFINMGYQENYLYKIYEPLNPYLNNISNFFNDGVKTIKPLQKILKDGIEFISLIFYIIFSILIWQTVVALKRHTKR